MSLESSQICWDCENYIDGCSWSREFILPKGVKLNDVGDIVFCPEFKRDKKVNIPYINCNKLSELYGKCKRTTLRHLDEALVYCYKKVGRFIYNEIIYDKKEIIRAIFRIKNGVGNPYKRACLNKKK